MHLFVYARISGERLHDNWSSGLKTDFLKFLWHYIQLYFIFDETRISQQDFPK